jgi:hypothetical protein
MLLAFVPDLLDQLDIATPHLIDKANGYGAMISILIAQLTVKNTEPLKVK